MSEKENNKMVRRVCFTLNNYTEEEYEECCSILEKQQYAIVGREIAPTTGTPHLQGYCELKTQKRFDTLKRQWGNRYRFASCVGTQEQNITYCSKEDKNAREFGQRRESGSRSDLDKVRLDAAQYGMRSVVRYANNQQINVAQKFLTYCEEPRASKPTVHWLFGPTGSGKSRKAQELAGDDDVYWKSDSNKWFDGYDGHSIVVLDDLRDTWFDFTDLLTLLDRYPRRVECKGGSRQWKPEVIIITSAEHPKSFYPESRENKKQLIRRIDHIEYIAGEWDDDVF